MISISANLNVMIKAAEKASKSVIRDFGEVEKLQVSKKGPYDFVTKTDKNVEKILIEELSKIKKDLVGEKGKLMTENLEVSVSFYNDNPISVELPNQVKCKIETTDVALKGQTVSSSYKPATLDNGLNVQVPPFIESGDEVIIDTRTFEYIKKI